MGRCGAASARVHSASTRFLRAGGSLGPGQQQQHQEMLT
ncbi:hypothetical protein A2U01_0038056, partial [Trifolium medium]|nr:hypothetical protein [Trifolium medium]